MFPDIVHHRMFPDTVEKMAENMVTLLNSLSLCFIKVGLICVQMAICYSQAVDVCLCIL